MSGVFENSDNVLKGLEHISAVLATVLESERQAAALDIQDNIDRTNISLMGYKEHVEGGNGGGKDGGGVRGRGSVGVGGSRLPSQGQQAT